MSYKQPNWVFLYLMGVALNKFTGYEKHRADLMRHNKESFACLSDKGKQEVIHSIFNIYRVVGLYPITQFTDKGVQEEIAKCRDKDIPPEADISSLRFNQGGAVCRFLFPNLREVEQGGDTRTLSRKFNDDHMLKRAIEFCLKYKSSKYPTMPSGVKDGLEMLGGGVATNFKPMNAKAIYERYCPKGGRILDYAAGYGGRMLGALSSKNRYTYVGVEPNTDTCNHLNTLRGHIESCLGYAGCDIINGCSEDEVSQIEGVFDFAFSSPPYFNLENYCDQDTQSHIRNPDIESWFANYVTPTVGSIFGKLKGGCLMCTNIADYNFRGKRVHLVDPWVDRAIDAGFEFLGTDAEMSMQTRRGSGHGVNSRDEKKEGLYLFRKPDSPLMS